jgi:hypothetical protein
VTYVILTLSFDYWQSARYGKTFRELLVTQRRLRERKLLPMPAVVRDVTDRVSCDNIKETCPHSPL